VNKKPTESDVYDDDFEEQQVKAKPPAAAVAPA